MATGTKKPKWGVVTLKQIEGKRKELGLSKTAMAKNLGITNSTYHNWARETTVPHPAQQDAIKAALASMTGNGTHAPKPRANKVSKGVRRGTKTRSTPVVPLPSGFTPTDNTPSEVTDRTVRGVDTASIATITAAYITSQSTKGPVTKEAVFDFISGLQRTFSGEAPAVASPAKVDEPAAATA